MRTTRQAPGRISLLRVPWQVRVREYRGRRRAGGWAVPVMRGAPGGRKAWASLRCGGAVGDTGRCSENRHGHCPTEKAVWPWRQWTDTDGQCRWRWVPGV